MTPKTLSLPFFIQALQNADYKEATRAGKALISQFNNHQFSKFDQHESVETLIKERTSFVDQLLKKIWQHYLKDDLKNQFSLIAVGGYGRAELQPFSDIDLLILGEDFNLAETAIANFLTYLWDIGFEVGHAVRNHQQCFDAAKADLSTATNLLESRWITGDYQPFERLQTIFKSPALWPTEQFFEAKVNEQTRRHSRFNNIVYQLEPNLKESPGGLRDIQTILWVAMRHFSAKSIQELMQYDFLTHDEYKEIHAAYLYLNRIRFALHRLKGRHEDRLLFDTQQSLAALLGYEDEPGSRAVEKLMKPYYQNVHIVAKLNEILLQHFREEIFKQTDDALETINPRFRLVNNYLDVHADNLFEKNPTALLEIFIILENHAQKIAGIRSRTIRLIRSHLHLINEQFRSDPINKALFIEIFRQPKGVNAALQRMHGYGILSAYLPCFKHITGLMQFNIFHAYTVDEHTLLVIRNLRRFFVDEHAYEFPTAHQVAKEIDNPEILLLAGLFHDIAKGRNGNHEKLGAIDAQNFAHQHNLSTKATKLLSWLVLHHLDFPYIAQKKDLSNPEVINAFAAKVKNQTYLNYLYLLTVADVLSTSPNVWNDWKNQLFIQLYKLTTLALKDSSNLPSSLANQATANKEKAAELLKAQDISSKHFQNLWQSLENSSFFNRQTPTEIAQITKLLAQDSAQESPTDTYVNIRLNASRGASELLIYMTDRDYLFAHITALIDKLNLNIMGATIYSSSDQKTLVIIYFLSRENVIIKDKTQLNSIKTKLENELSKTDIEPITAQAQPRRIRVFETPTEINMVQLNEHQTELTIHTKDIPGLLAKIGKALKQCHIRLHDAKINTLGEKVEDVFIISTVHNEPVQGNHDQQTLKAALLYEIA